MPRTPTSSSSVWTDHYATGAGFRYWPCEELVRALAGRRLGTVVEVGCGNGANLWMLAEHADRVVGVDDCKSALDAAAEYTHRRGVDDTVFLKRGDIRSLPFEAGTADGLVDVMVSQHVRWQEHEALYREYRRVLRPGGWFFLYHLGMGTTEAGGGRLVESFTRERIGLFPSAGQVCLPPRWALVEAMERAGFKVVAPRAVTRFYAGGEAATYHVIEGEAA